MPRIKYIFDSKCGYRFLSVAHFVCVLYQKMFHCSALKCTEMHLVSCSALPAGKYSELRPSGLTTLPRFSDKLREEKSKERGYRKSANERKTETKDKKNES